MTAECGLCSAKATWELVWADGRAVARSCANHKDKVKRLVAQNPHAEIVGWRRVRPRRKAARR